MTCFKHTFKNRVFQDHHHNNNTKMLKKHKNKKIAATQQQLPRSSLIASNSPIQNKYEYIPKKYRSGYKKIKNKISIFRKKNIFPFKTDCNCILRAILLPTLAYPSFISYTHQSLAFSLSLSLSPFEISANSVRFTHLMR